MMIRFRGALVERQGSLMVESNQPVVLAVATFLSVRSIDGGDTVVMQFKGPDGREIAVLVPRQAALELHTPLADVLALVSSRVRHKP